MVNIRDFTRQGMRYRSYINDNLAISIDYSITTSFSDFALIIIHSIINRFLNFQKGKNTDILYVFLLF